MTFSFYDRVKCRVLYTLWPKIEKYLIYQRLSSVFNSSFIRIHCELQQSFSRSCWTPPLAVQVPWVIITQYFTAFKPHTSATLLGFTLAHNFNLCLAPHLFRSTSDTVLPQLEKTVLLLNFGFYLVHPLFNTSVLDTCFVTNLLIPCSCKVSEKYWEESDRGLFYKTFWIPSMLRWIAVC
jgi:hypothetical protein